jgi:hypothetical protein
VNAIPNPANSNTDKNFLVSLLRESRENFLGSFAGVLKSRVAFTQLKIAGVCLIPSSISRRLKASC